MSEKINNKIPDVSTVRKPVYPIEKIFLKRWSPRAMSGEKITDDQLMTLFEAAHWAPSTFNEQEWRFVYAAHGTAYWDTFFDFLVPENQAWCNKASHLVIVFSRKTFTKNGKPNPVHEFDTGAAFENLCLQAASMGLVCHGMAGFLSEKIREKLAVPEEFSIHAMVALGVYGGVEDLPDDLRRKDEPSMRKALSEIVEEGRFSFQQ